MKKYHIGYQIIISILGLLAIGVAHTYLSNKNEIAAEIGYVDCMRDPISVLTPARCENIKDYHITNTDLYD